MAKIMTMNHYQALARRYRPKRFKDVIGQDPIVTTLINALKRQKISHAYLFCGCRGTGKTTLARLFAKALNCQHPSDEKEPCNSCASCREIDEGRSLDVLEIDGASHRGIEDIRKIHETIGYAPSVGHYKIYLIDEVHMLTKEAFNALLKTLEEPPPQVKFLFATTEPHRLPSTVLSRCNRFQLRRLSPDLIQKKLTSIAQDVEISIQQEALIHIAERAEGSLRDAESLFEQVIAYHQPPAEISSQTVCDALGLVPRETLFSLAQAGENQDFSKIFSMVQDLFSSGIQVSYFFDELISHFRTILLLKSGFIPQDLLLHRQEQYAAILPFYKTSQCADIVEMLLEAQQQLRFAPSEKVALEAALIRILRSHKTLSLETLVERLLTLEKNLSPGKNPPAASPSPISSSPPKTTVTPPSVKKPSTPPPEPPSAPVLETQSPSLPPVSPVPTKIEAPEQQSRIDTLLRFAAKELQGTLKKE